MKLKSLIKQTIFYSLFFILLNVTSVHAEKANPIQLKMSVVEEIETTNSEGQKITKQVEPVNIVPGDQVVYITQYHNTSAQNAHNILITNPIPKHLVYLKGSAEQNNATVTYSIDGGKTFKATNQLNVLQKDGIKRPALAQDYTHIRWKIQSISSGEKGMVQFKARLK